MGEIASPAAILSILVEANTGKATTKIKKFDESLNMIAKKRVTAEIGVDINRVQLSAIKKELDALDRKKAAAKLKIDGTAKALAEIKGVNAELRKFSGKTYKANIKVDTKGTAKADAALEKTNALASDKKKKITVDVNRSKIARAIGAFRGLGTNMNKASQDAGALTRAMSGLKAAFGSGGGGGSSWTDQAALSFKDWAMVILGSLPIIIDFTAALGALAASAAAAAAGVGALAVGGAGAAGVGLAGIVSIAGPAIASLKTLITTMDQVHLAQATQAQTAGRAQAAAAQAIKSANQQVVSANESLKTSEQSLASAQKAEQVAQQALTLARRDAVRQLQDMKLAADEAGLSEQRAKLSLAEAEQNLKRLQQSGTATALELADAELSVREARANLTDTTVQGQRAQQDYQNAHQKGLNKMPQVVAAQRALKAATQSVSSAQDGVKHATEGVQSALEHLTYEQKRSTTATKAGGTQMAALRYQMKKAGPDAVAFAKSLLHLKNRWLALTQPGRKDFFDALRDALDRVINKLPMLARSANNSMGALRKGFGIFLRQVTGPEFTTFIHTMTHTFVKATPVLADAFGRIGKILERIAVAAAPEVLKMVKAFDRMIKSWDKSTSNASELKKTIHELVQNTWAWMHLIEATAQLIVAVFVPGVDLGKKAVRGVTAQLHEWTDWVKNHPEEMKGFFAQGLETTKELFAILLPLIHQLFVMGEAMRPLAQAVLDISKWLLSINIGKINALEIIIGTIVAFKLAKWAIGVAEAFRLIPPAAAAAAPAIEAEGAAAGTGYASKLGSALKKAIPYAFAAFAIGNVISSAVKGDTKGALAKTGGALAGALVGFMVGGIPGAMVGSGIGSLLGGLLGNALNKSVAHLGLGHIEAKLEREIKTGAKAEKKASKAIKDSADIVQRARHKEHKATKNLRDLEDKRAQDLKKYGPLSKRVAEDDSRIANARHREANKTRDLKQAEHLHGDILKANKTLIAHQLVLDNQRVDNLKKMVKRAKENFDQDKNNRASAQRLVDVTGKLNKAQIDLGKQNVHAINVLGPGVAKQLQQQGKKAAQAAENYLHFKNQMANWGTGTTISTGQAISNEQRYRRDQQKTIEKLQRLKGETDAAWRARKRLASVAGPATPIPGKSGVGHKQKGGIVGAQKGMLVGGSGSGDKVHLQAMVEPGEKVFVLNRNASSALGALQGINSAVPRFQGGGEVTPQIVALAVGGEAKAVKPPKNVHQLLNRVQGYKPKQIRRALKDFESRYKKLDLPSGMIGNINNLNDAANRADEMYNNAITYDPDGLLPFGGKTATQWLDEEFNDLATLRNALLDAEKFIEDSIRKANEKLRKLNRKVTILHGDLAWLEKNARPLGVKRKKWSDALARDNTSLDTDVAALKVETSKDKAHQNAGKINQLKQKIAVDKQAVQTDRDQLGSIGAVSAYRLREIPIAKELAALTGKDVSFADSSIQNHFTVKASGAPGLIPALTDHIKSLNAGDLGDAGSVVDLLNTVQGPGPTLNIAPGAYPVSVPKDLMDFLAGQGIGGQMLTVASELAGVGSSGGGGDGTLGGLKDQQIQALEQQLLVSQLQTPVFQDFMTHYPFAGFFAKGGSIPARMWGIAGEEGPEPILGPATVMPNQKSSGATAGSNIAVHVHGTIHTDRSLEDAVAVFVDGKLQKDVSVARRRA